MDKEYQRTENELFISDEIRSFLHQTAKWTKFMSIIGFIAILIMLLVGLTMSFAGGSYTGAGDSLSSAIEGLGSIWTAVIYLFFALLYFVPILYLFRFSNLVNTAMINDDQYTLEEAFNYLRKHYRFIGILTAFFIGLYVLMFVLMVLFI